MDDGRIRVVFPALVARTGEGRLGSDELKFGYHFRCRQSLSGR